jgi:hypothetical protein
MASLFVCWWLLFVGFCLLLVFSVAAVFVGWLLFVVVVFLLSRLHCHADLELLEPGANCKFAAHVIALIVLFNSAALCGLQVTLVAVAVPHRATEL